MPADSRPAHPPVEMFQFVPPGMGRLVSVIGGASRFLVVGSQTAGRYALWEAAVPPGTGPPLHMHSRESEAFFVLEGELMIEVDGQRTVGTAGSFVHLEPGTKHRFKNESNAPARMLILVTPAGLENFFLEVGVPLSSMDETLPPPSAAEIGRLMAIAPRYGLTIFPPPGHAH